MLLWCPRWRAHNSAGLSSLVAHLIHDQGRRRFESCPRNSMEDTTTLYERAVTRNVSLGDTYQELMYSGFGLTGEAGEFAGEVKKYLRHVTPYPANTIEMLDELGDVFYYGTRLALVLGSNLNNVFDAHIAKLAARRMKPRVSSV